MLVNESHKLGVSFAIIKLIHVAGLTSVCEKFVPCDWDIDGLPLRPL
jgi:hypothetical protein